MKLASVLLVACLVAFAAADMYMHNPPGSNNRVDDNNNAPANRLFDSQNNNNFGYNQGPNEQKLSYYMGSTLMLEWTAQHACSDPKLNCEIIWQYRCDPLMRTGSSRNQPQETIQVTDEDGNTQTVDAPIDFEPSADRGRHEPFANWYECERRSRNRGLFLADNNVGGQARSTRQNPGGGRSGYECAEERDYYPYWHPSYWVDLVVMTDNMTRCDYYQEESQNVMDKGHCSSVQYNTQGACEANGGTWMVDGSFGVEPPQCVEAPWSRQNHHGNGMTPTSWNSDLTAGELAMGLAHYNLTFGEGNSLAPNPNCILRLRYNMSTNDYDGWTADYTLNGAASPVQDDPEVDIGIGTELELNINTNQFGRTFQDRSHPFQILPKPATIQEGCKIWNLNVRGKRGNNNNVYPNVEYDFVPNRLHLDECDYVHYQWGGSNNNPQGTDRSNVVQIADPNDNMPLYMQDVTMFEGDANAAYELGTACGATDGQLQTGGTYCEYPPIQMNTPGTYHYMSTKNNAYSNRSQKGTIIVGAERGSGSFSNLSGGAKAGVAIAFIAGGVVLVAAVVVGIMFFMGTGAFAGKRGGSKPSSAGARF